MSQIQTAILCGGRGTRLREHTATIPKVLVEIGGYPILWHILKGYSQGGYNDFVLALGYLGEKIEEHFAAPDRREAGWNIDFQHTGTDTNTGGRILRLESSIRGDTFFATYGDGVADVDLDALLAFHREHGRAATVTIVRPRSPFGMVEVDDELHVVDFKEKPLMDQWISGGFFVFDRRIFDYLEDDSILEREPMQRLAADGELMAYRHQGFWACMDTYKDTVELNSAWADGGAPWCTWCET
jgi:glucose-1-phosphate cytidylyltransferase